MSNKHFKRTLSCHVLPLVGWLHVREKWKWPKVAASLGLSISTSKYLCNLCHEILWDTTSQNCYDNDSSIGFVRNLLDICRTLALLEKRLNRVAKTFFLSVESDDAAPATWKLLETTDGWVYQQTQRLKSGTKSSLRQQLGSFQMPWQLGPQRWDALTTSLKVIKAS